MPIFESLPLEILQHICNDVAADCKLDLYNYSLVSRRCCLASNPQRFQTIRFPDLTNLSDRLACWNDVLQARSSFTYVRWLIVGGFLPFGSDSRNEKLISTTEDDLEDYDAGTIVGGPYYGRLSDEKDDDWKPLSRFIMHLPRLLNFVYSAIGIFPPCLMDALRSIPNCRLHLHSFGLGSLVQPPDQPQDIDPYEYSLATCPQLYCVILQHSLYTTEGLRNYNYEATQLMAAGLAPNLKRVRLIIRRPGSSPEYVAALRQPWAPWQGFFPSRPQQPLQPGHLNALGFGASQVTDIREWSKYITFSSLRTLKWDAEGVSTEMFRWLSTCNFSSLKTLVLNLEGFRIEYEQMDKVAGALLLNLPPLHSLKLTGVFGQQTFQAVLGHHTLYQLWLSSPPDTDAEQLVITAKRVSELAKCCARLEELTLLVPRSQGSKEKVLIYRLLGSLPGLRNLTLYLDCTDLTAYNLSDSELDEEEDDVLFPKLDKGLVRKRLINAAVDEPLALAIYREIIQGKPRNMPTLQCVKLHVSGAYELASTRGHLGLSSIIDVIGRSWEISRNPTRRDDCDDVVVQEVGRQEREERIKVWSEWNGSDILEELVFREIWPEETGDWKTDWHSFPLMSN
ncbi:uncharacterized protein GIQ15_06028 [Arthroderma uncinatum]|uniref:uncharacterized protein n=1 Tax=Arthroderma uncinatum TaxID=74035 RepID=UPI00144AF958|nr:uncharacterized protein GIQ15_06028 [Arthroderma uncinatum]KAF3480681.1 hypothetical protein GIQ15_06028 [Arthroderma uncinatum]